MPTVVIIGNLKIVIFFNDTDRHHMAHYHVLSPEGRAAVAIDNNVILASDLSARKIRKALDWTEANRATLVAAWNRCNPHRLFEEK